MLKIEKMLNEMNLKLEHRKAKSPMRKSYYAIEVDDDVRDTTKVYNQEPRLVKEVKVGKRKESTQLDKLKEKENDDIAIDQILLMILRDDLYEKEVFGRFIYTY